MQSDNGPPFGTTPALTKKETIIAARQCLQKERPFRTEKEAIMNTKRLGNSDLFITPLGFGGWAIGGSGWEFAWGGQDDSDSVAAIHEALGAGINWIDTAAVYGLGHSEEVVARALAGVRDRPYVFTKCSMIWDAHREI